MAFLPRINAFGSYSLNDSKAFKFGNDSYLVGINLSWTIFSGNQNRSKMKSAQFQRDKIQEEFSLHIKKEELELNKTKRDLNDQRGNAVTKAQAQHPEYRKVMMVYWEEQREWRVVEYDPAADKNLLDRLLRPELMAVY